MTTHSPALEPPLLLETVGGVARLTLNRPARRNALSRELLIALQDTLDTLASDALVRVVVLGARGPVFSSGHDLSEMAGATEQDHADLFDRCARVMMRLRRLPQPVIARVQGIATAAGCQLVAACDLAVASESATFATPGVKIGLFCTTPMVPLVRTIAPRAALEMLLLGRPIGAARALELGLVNRVVPEAQLDQAVEDYCTALLASSAAVLRQGKAAFYDLLALTEAEAYDRAVPLMAANAQQDDAREGMRAFLEKRPPRWPGQ